ncbi:MAG: hypothetical protein AB8B85_02660 [Paracoccaceae bacterium]
MAATTGTLILPAVAALAFGVGGGGATSSISLPVVSVGPGINALAGGVTTSLTLFLPSLDVTGTAGRIAQTIPALTVSGTAVHGSQTTYTDIRIRRLQLLATGVKGKFAKGDRLTLPELTATGTAGALGGASFAIPKLAVSGTALKGSFTRGNLLALPPVKLSADAGGTNTATGGRLTLRPLQNAATAIHGHSARVGLTLPRLQLSAQAVAGTATASGSMVLPALTASGNLHTIPVTTGANLSLPPIRLTGATYSPTVTVVDAATPVRDAVDTALVFNLQSFAATSYRKWRFNSFANRPDGTVWACNDTGVYLLGGETDNTVAIETVSKLPITDFGISELKRVLQLWANYRSKGEMHFRVRLDDQDDYFYPIRPYNASGLYRNRTKVGRKLVATNWQIEIESSAYFELSQVEVDMMALEGRRLSA